MNCPTCQNERLVMSERQGIEIDYCPRCRGVWLDRGELDKIIERSSQGQGDVQPTRPVPAQPQQSMYDSDHSKYRYKRKSWLAELFD